MNNRANINDVLTFLINNYDFEMYHNPIDKIYSSETSRYLKINETYKLTGEYSTILLNKYDNVLLARDDNNEKYIKIKEYNYEDI